MSFFGLNMEEGYFEKKNQHPIFLWMVKYLNLTNQRMKFIKDPDHSEDKKYQAVSRMFTII
jgi:hypothetical protein